MAHGWLIDGKWIGPPRGSRIGHSKGNREAQREREKVKRQLASRLAEEALKLAREAGTARRRGRPSGSHSKAQEQKAKWSRRRLWGKQKPLGVTAIAKQAQAKAIAAQAKADALVAKSKSLDLLASAAKEEAQQARARAQEAEKKAEVYKQVALIATLWCGSMRLPA